MDISIRMEIPSLSISLPPDYDPFQPDVEGRFVSPGTAFGMDKDTVVVASVVCEAQSVAIQVSELPGLCGDIGSGPGTPFPEHKYMLDVPDLWTFVDDEPEWTLSGVQRHVWPAGLRQCGGFWAGSARSGAQS